ncbi:MAG: sensor histidine kinase [Chloroflexota bacterium]
MKVTEALERIHRPWLIRNSRTLARGEDLRESFEQMLEAFYNRVQQAVETGDPSWLDPLLEEWVAARTETELDNQSISLPAIINRIHMQTFEIGRESLPESDALELAGALLPIFVHAYEHSSRLEMERNIQHMANELDSATATLERLDRSKSDFIAIAAHELKTPLTLIEGYTAMLRDQLPSTESFDYSRVLIKGVDNGTRRLREIVDDMIDVSLIDNNLLSLNFQPLWINRLLDLLRDEFDAIAAERRLEMRFLPFPGADEMTFGDGERLYQAFRNLFSNSIKYTPDGGRITVDGRKLPGFVEITFSDTGIGIDPDDHLRIFEKFGRLGSVSLHSSGKTKFKGGGPGLGLPITKGIIEAHGGSIWVESPGCDEKACPGAIFHVLLPARRMPPDDRSARLFSPLVDLDQAGQD